MYKQYLLCVARKYVSVPLVRSISSNITGKQNFTIKSILYHQNTFNAGFLRWPKTGCFPNQLFSLEHPVYANKTFSTSRLYSNQKGQSYFIKYITIWRNNPLPIWVGLLAISILQYRRVRKRQADEVKEPQFLEEIEANPIPSWLIKAYEQLPLDMLSRVVGYVLNDIHLPIWAREPVISLYASTFRCRVHEAEKGDDWTAYDSLGDFFRRRLKKEVRPINKEAILTSPCDGRILTCGTIDYQGNLEQVKGLTYPLEDFLGQYVPGASGLSNDGNCKYDGKYVPKENTRLYHCTMYLAPGDYHCFHAPTNWTIEVRRHFIGKLLSVRPSLVGKIPRIFSLNERVVYLGKWSPDANKSENTKKNSDYFFAFAAIGATNVGSILIEMDGNLKTNKKGKYKKTKPVEEQIFYGENNLTEITKGDYFGEFNLGSSIVIVFEAPLDFTFDVRSGQRIFVGEPLAFGSKT